MSEGTATWVYEKRDHGKKRRNERPPTRGSNKIRTRVDSSYHSNGGSLGHVHLNENSAGDLHRRVGSPIIISHSASRYGRKRKRRPGSRKLDEHKTPLQTARARQQNMNSNQNISTTSNAKKIIGDTNANTTTRAKAMIGNINKQQQQQQQQEKQKQQQQQNSQAQKKRNRKNQQQQQDEIQHDQSRQRLERKKQNRSQQSSRQKHHQKQKPQELPAAKKQAPNVNVKAEDDAEPDVDTGNNAIDDANVDANAEHFALNDDDTDTKTKNFVENNADANATDVSQANADTHDADNDFTTTNITTDKKIPQNKKCSIFPEVELPVMAPLAEKIKRSRGKIRDRVNVIVDPIVIVDDDNNNCENNNAADVTDSNTHDNAFHTESAKMDKINSDYANNPNVLDIFLEDDDVNKYHDNDVHDHSDIATPSTPSSQQSLQKQQSVGDSVRSIPSKLRSSLSSLRSKVSSSKRTRAALPSGDETKTVRKRHRSSSSRSSASTSNGILSTQSSIAHSVMTIEKKSVSSKRSNSQLNKTLGKKSVSVAFSPPSSPATVGLDTTQKKQPLEQPQQSHIDLCSDEDDDIEEEEKKKKAVQKQDIKNKTNNTRSLETRRQKQHRETEILQSPLSNTTSCRTRYQRSVEEENEEEDDDDDNDLRKCNDKMNNQNNPNGRVKQDRSPERKRKNNESLQIEKPQEEFAQQQQLHSSSSQLTTPGDDNNTSTPSTADAVFNTTLTPTNSNAPIPPHDDDDSDDDDDDDDDGMRTSLMDPFSSGDLSTTMISMERKKTTNGKASASMKSAVKEALSSEQDVCDDITPVSPQKQNDNCSVVEVQHQQHKQQNKKKLKLSKQRIPRTMKGKTSNFDNPAEWVKNAHDSSTHTNDEKGDIIDKIFSERKSKYNYDEKDNIIDKFFSERKSKCNSVVENLEGAEELVQEKESTKKKIQDPLDQKGQRQHNEKQQPNRNSASGAGFTLREKVVENSAKNRYIIKTYGSNRKAKMGNRITPGVSRNRPMDAFDFNSQAAAAAPRSNLQISPRKNSCLKRHKKPDYANNSEFSSGNYSTRSKKKKKSEQVVILDDDSDIDDNPEPIDLVRIALGKKVFDSGCQVSYDTGNKMLKMLFKNKKTLQQQQCWLRLAEDECLKEFKYYTGDDDDNEIDDDDINNIKNNNNDSDDELLPTSFLVMRIEPGPSNNLRTYSSCYRWDADDHKRYIVLEFRDEKDMVELLDIMKNSSMILSTFVEKDAEITISKMEPFFSNDILHKYAKALIDHSNKEKRKRLQQECLGSPIVKSLRSQRNNENKNNTDAQPDDDNYNDRLNKRVYEFLKDRSEDETIMVYPFDGDLNEIERAAHGLKEASGCNDTRDAGVVDDNNHNSTGSNINDKNNNNNTIIAPNSTNANEQKQQDLTNNTGTATGVRARRHFLTIQARDYERLIPGEFLNDTLVDFWIQWITRKDDQYSSQIHCFSSHFLTTLMDEGVANVTKWTSKKGINVFEKRFIFIPVNQSLHWSLCVVVNPGKIMSCYENDSSQKLDGENGEAEQKCDNDALPCILFLDSLKAHRKNKITGYVKRWLNSEWNRISNENNDGGNGDKKNQTNPFNKGSCPVYDPKIPYQDNSWDCGVFVCRYAYAMYLLRNKNFFRKDLAFLKEMITTPEFDFGMDDIVRLRDDMRELIERLSRIYVVWKAEQDRQEREERRKEKQRKIDQMTEKEIHKQPVKEEEVEENGCVKEGQYQNKGKIEKSQQEQLHEQLELDQVQTELKKEVKKEQKKEQNVKLEEEQELEHEGHENECSRENCANTKEKRKKKKANDMDKKHEYPISNFECIENENKLGRHASGVLVEEDRREEVKENGEKNIISNHRSEENSYTHVAALRGFNDDDSTSGMDSQGNNIDYAGI